MIHLLNKIKEKEDGGSKEKLEKERDEFIEANYYYLNVENIFFVDDFIGTGRSAVTFLTELLKYESAKSFNIYLFALEISQDAMIKLEKFASLNEINLILLYSRMSINVLEENVVFNKSEIISARKNIHNVSSKYKIEGGGFCINNAIASYVNAPNNNLPLLYKRKNGWTPIFKRTNKVPSPKPNSSEIKDLIKN